MWCLSGCELKSTVLQSDLKSLWHMHEACARFQLKALSCKARLSTRRLAQKLPPGALFSTKSALPPLAARLVRAEFIIQYVEIGEVR